MRPKNLPNLFFINIFYAIKPHIPRKYQIFFRRRIAQYKRRRYSHIWPIDPNSATPPDGWAGWPGGKKFAMVLCHDVDTAKGYRGVLKLADLEEKAGFRSQFNFVPERYGKIDIDLLDALKSRGFGVGVHGLHHDGKLFRSKEIFDQRAPRINAYLREWGTRGFTTPSMIRNHEWMDELDVDFCVSTFDTDPFEPQSEGARTIFPYWVRRESSDRGFLELPYTLVQDFTLFSILGEKNIDVWEKKLDWIAHKGGMALLNTHPDYMNFGSDPCCQDEYPVQFYSEFLEHIKNRYGSVHWQGLPYDVWCYIRSQIMPSEDLEN
jgi:hypothetical protein